MTDNQVRKNCSSFFIFDWNADDFEILIKSCDRDDAKPFIMRYMPKDGKILDAGCGLGRYTAYLNERGFEVTGIEFNQETVKNVLQIAPNLNVMTGDVSSLQYEDNSISGIICLGVIEHFFLGPEKPLKELRRVLKPGHYAIFTVPAFNVLRRIKHFLGIRHFSPIKIMKEMSVVRRILKKKAIPAIHSDFVPYRHKCKEVSDHFYEYRFTKKEFEAELIRAGFTIVESLPIALMDGIYHEFGDAFVSFREWTFYPNMFGKFLNWSLGKIPNFHNHMYLCVVKK